MFQDLYTSGAYLHKNPDWHVEESPWKSRNILRMLTRNGIVPATVCEVGCGAGEVLRLLQREMSHATFCGYDISPHALELSRSRANERLHFELTDIRDKPHLQVDLMLLLDVIEHVEDYFSLLRDIKGKAKYTIFQIPLDLSVQTILRGRSLLRKRERWGHIHYFTAETALQLLRETGFEPLDCFYTSPPPSTAFRDRLLSLLLRIPLAVHPQLTVRLFGMARLVVLAS